jgi:hypothetical protein
MGIAAMAGMLLILHIFYRHNSYINQQGCLTENEKLP